MNPERRCASDTAYPEIREKKNLLNQAVGCWEQAVTVRSKKNWRLTGTFRRRPTQYQLMRKVKMSKTTMKPVAAAIGAAFVGSMMLAGSASAASNPFGLSELNGGYAQIAGNEGKCGGSMSTDKPAEGKCGGSKPAEGKCGGSMSTEKAAEGKCGAGKCGGSMSTEKAAEGKC
ncbi:MAG: hypothetical protein WBM81_08025, partial [Sedimenticolaceae bacterium]